MIENALIKYQEVVDEEIGVFENIEELYKIKQSILIQGKSDALWDLDERILHNFSQIKELETQRKTVASHMGNEEITLTEIIEKAKNSDALLAKKLMTQREKLKILSKSIKLYETSNIELVKHGLVMVGKRFDLMLNLVRPKPEEYNKFGKSDGVPELQISSIVEEA